MKATSPARSKPSASKPRPKARAAAARRRDIRDVWDSPPRKIERETLLTPEWVAESVVREAERFLGTGLPEDFTGRLAARALRLYGRHAHFTRRLRAGGNRGRENLRMYMRHWTCAWLKRDRSPLFQRLPRDYALGKPLP